MYKYKHDTFMQENKTNQRVQADSRISGIDKKHLARIQKTPYEDLRVNFRTRQPLQMMLKRSDVRIDKDRTQEKPSTYYRNANSFCTVSNNLGVVQGVFKKYHFTRDVYLRRAMEVLKEAGFLTHQTTLDDFREEIYEKGNQRLEDKWFVYTKKFMADSERHKRQFAKWDILMNLLDHFDTESKVTEKALTGANEIQGEVEDEEKERIYSHYQMYDELPEEESILDDRHHLLSAIDCTILKEEKYSELNGVIWIESFISFESGMGKQLLRKLLSYEFGEYETVALGAYLGTEDYYKGLGFEKKENLYVTEDGKFYNEKEAVKYCNSVSGEEMTESEAIQYGLDELVIYPVYAASKEKILEQL